MEYVKKWAVAVILTCIITAIIKFLVPEGNIKKCACTILSFTVLLVILSPLTDDKSVFPKLEKAPDVFSEITYNENSSVYNNAIVTSVENALYKGETEFSKVTAEMYIDDEGYIIIDNIEITTKSKSDDETIKKTVADETGFNADIITIRRK